MSQKLFTGYKEHKLKGRPKASPEQKKKVEKQNAAIKKSKSA